MQTNVPTAEVARAGWYAAPVPVFLASETDTVLGVLTKHSRFDVARSQRDAWLRELAVLRDVLVGIDDGWLYLEFDVPRLGTRIDAVVAARSAVVPIEFKVGEREYTTRDLEQAWDYGLDLKNFHAASHAADIFPMLVCTDAHAGDAAWEKAHPDGVRPPRRSNAAGLGDALRHSVEAITRNDAGAANLGITSRRVEDLIDERSRDGGKAIVFVTGVPGAGKTLVGLNIATRRRQGTTHAVYLSGNGPLVAVLREALTRDELSRRRAHGETAGKGAVAQPVKAFIQNVHHFRDDGLRDETRPPADHVVIFDESQRAWNREKTSDFMRRRKNRAGFAQSEPEFLLGYMDRHPDWAVVICLVGGGQEIHTGEAGIGAWLDAVRTAFPHWQVHVSPNLHDAEYAAADAIAALAGATHVHLEPDLHLAVSMRSFRAEHVSSFVKAVLDGEVAVARAYAEWLASRYPIAVTRDLARARTWIRQKARGTERVGLVASSQAQRLKPHAIDVRVSIDPVHYFLDDPSDTRSSCFLEDAATEFQIQGLELDWACITWDADLIAEPVRGSARRGPGTAGASTPFAAPDGRTCSRPIVDATCGTRIACCSRARAKGW